MKTKTEYTIEIAPITHVLKTIIYKYTGIIFLSQYATVKDGF